MKTRDDQVFSLQADLQRLVNRYLSGEFDLNVGDVLIAISVVEFGLLETAKEEDE